MTYQVIAAAQAGAHNHKRESYGDTLIIDPWGTIVGRLPGKKLDTSSHIHQAILVLKYALMMIFCYRSFVYRNCGS